MSFIPFDGNQPHRYTTIDSIRAAGIPAAALSDTDALRLIEVVSSLIKAVTDQWFVPVFQLLRLDGEGDRLLHHPKLLPILKIFSLKFVDTVGSVTLTTDEFVISPNRRSIKRKPLLNFFGTQGRRRIAADPLLGRPQFHKSVDNIELNSIYGWLDGFKEVETTTSTLINNASTSVEIADPAGILVNDVLIALDDDNNQAAAIVTSITTGPNTLNFDVLDTLSTPVASGARLLVFGRVPFLVERAALLVINDLKAKIGSNTSLQNALQQGIISERTDNYSYKLAAPTGGDLSDRDNSTGNLIADNLLGNFVAPPYIAFA